MAFPSQLMWTIKSTVLTITTVCLHQNALVVEKVLFFIFSLIKFNWGVFLGITPVEGTEETVRVVAMDKDFHVDCYICEECGMQLTDEPDKRCYPYDGRLMCRSCHIQKISLQDMQGRMVEPVSATYQYMG